jgi:hypothetical protein
MNKLNKREAIAYLRRKRLLERRALATETNPEAAYELAEMEKSPKSERKNLTAEESNV